jgi:hypothetical protein
MQNFNSIGPPSFALERRGGEGRRDRGWTYLKLPILKYVRNRNQETKFKRPLKPEK